MRALVKMMALLHYYQGAFIFYSGLGQLHVRLHDYGVLCLRRAADKGHKDALMLIGMRLKYRGVNRHHKMTGIKYLRESAKLGSVQSQFMLAEALVDESLVIDNFDEEEIQNLYGSAAHQGHKMAALRLSKAYDQGLWGLSINQKKAEYWSQQFFSEQ